MTEKRPPAPLDLGKFFLICASLGATVGVIWFLWPSSPNPYARAIPRI